MPWYEFVCSEHEGEPEIEVVICSYSVLDEKKKDPPVCKKCKNSMRLNQTPKGQPGWSTSLGIQK